VGSSASDTKSAVRVDLRGEREKKILRTDAATDPIGPPLSYREEATLGARLTCLVVEAQPSGQIAR
jgi:hypothetical protein